MCTGILFVYIVLFWEVVGICIMYTEIGSPGY